MKEKLKLKNVSMDKEIIKEKFTHIKKSSKIKLNLMGKKLKKIAIESQNEMEKFGEKAKHFINTNVNKTNYNKQIKYDENGNILDVQIFIIKPKIDHRIITIEKQKILKNINENENENDEMEIKYDLIKKKSKHSKTKIFVEKSSKIFKKIELKKKKFNKKKLKRVNNNSDDGDNDNDNNEMQDDINKKKKL
eukprot:31417_1